MVEQVKQQLLEYFSGLETLDFKKTPTFYFLSQLQDMLWERSCVPPAVMDAVLSSNINLGALGNDYEPHKEWLDELAEKYVVLVERISNAFFSEGFDVPVVCSYVKKFGITLE